jgi:hypothetical protein
VPPGVLEAARQFGSHVHAAIDLLNRDALDWGSLDAGLRPYVAGWQRFLDDSGCVVLASEQPVVHERLGYAGTPDSVLYWPNKKRPVIPDVKSTAALPRSVGAQTAAYAHAYQAMHGGPMPLRGCVHLLGDGKYAWHVRNDPADFSLFVSCLNIRRFLNGQ